MTAAVRTARADDAPALVALRVSMFESMGSPTVHETWWQAAAESWFVAHVDDPGVALRVVEVDGQVVAAAVGHVHLHLPSPGNVSGRMVTISNVSTFEEHRGHGYARMAFEAVLAWARDESDAETVDLFATAMGQGMYERSGFTVHPMPQLRLRLREP